MLHFTGKCVGLPDSQRLFKRFSIDFKPNAVGLVNASHAVFVRLGAQRCGFCAMPPRWASFWSVVALAISALPGLLPHVYIQQSDKIAIVERLRQDDSPYKKS